MQRHEVECAHCHAPLEVEVALETNETLADDVPEDVVVACPRCGARFEMTFDSGVESVEVRLRDQRSADD